MGEARDCVMWLQPWGMVVAFHVVKDRKTCATDHTQAGLSHARCVGRAPLDQHFCLGSLTKVPQVAWHVFHWSRCSAQQWKHFLRVTDASLWETQAGSEETGSSDV